MTAPVDSVEIFELRCWARAYLFALGALDLHEAVDVLQIDAEFSGLADEISQDKIQSLIAAAFTECRL